MLTKLPRRSAKRAASLTGRSPIVYDRHGDLVDHDFVDDHGANAVPTQDPIFSRWLAMPPLERRSR